MVAPPETPSEKTFAIEFGPVVGLAIPTNAFGLGPDMGVEVGGRLRIGPGAFTFALRGTWHRNSLTISSATPCAPMGSGVSNANAAPASPCVSTPTTGAYTSTLDEDVVRVSLPLTYRFLAPSSAFNAYAGVAPQLVLQRAESIAWNLSTIETATSFGVAGLAGAMYRLGPGSLWLEALYAWSPVNHRATGDSSLSNVTLAIGYRVSL